LANQKFPKNEEILLNSIGSGVKLEEVKNTQAVINDNIRPEKKF